MKTRILIVDDHGLMREGLKLIIIQQPDMEIVGEACDGREAVEKVRTLKPDVVLMDVSMPNLNGIEATRQIISERPDTKVLALSAYSEKRFVKDMIQAGVCGYVLKDCLTTELVRAIKSVCNKERYLSPKVAGVVIEDYLHVGGEQSSQPSKLTCLTGRERELFQLLAENKSTKEAAMLLNISIKTVDARRRELMHKLGVTGMAELTKLAIREGITSVDF